MPDHGHINVSRKAFQPLEKGGDELWNEPRQFSRWEAWVYLIQVAAFAAHNYAPPGHRIVHLERGETKPLSVRHLMKEWGWGSPRRVHSFLSYLQQDGRIAEQQRTALGNTYLVVNYDRYQGSRNSAGTPNGTEPEQSRNRAGTIDKQGKKGKKRTPSSGAGAPAASWSARACDIWTEQMRGEPKGGQIGKALKPLVDKYGEAEVLDFWERYLRKAVRTGRAAFANAQDFAAKYGQHKAAGGMLDSPGRTSGRARTADPQDYGTPGIRRVVR